MPRTYVVVEGDCISSLAFTFGLLPATIWNHPDNGELKNRSQDLNVLSPGSILTIPDKTPKEVSCATDQRHVFKKLATPVHLRLRLLDQGKPVAGAEYRLSVDGRIQHGTTDGQGNVEEWIPNIARKALLYINERLNFHIDLGYLDPVDQESGVRRRLQNLGMLYDKADHETYLWSIQKFKEMYCGSPPLPPDADTPEDDTFSPAERQKLVSIHGS